MKGGEIVNMNILNHIVYPVIVAILSSLFSQLIGTWLVNHRQDKQRKHKHKD